MAELESMHDADAHAVAAALKLGLWRRLVGAVREVANSEIGGKFRLRLGAILLLLFAINGLNVIGSYIGRNLMTAIEQRAAASFFSMALLWMGVFAALTGAAVILRFIEERLGVLWRDWLTRRFVARYLERGAYLRLKERGELGNPDQRIADDARAFTTTTLSFMLLFLNAVFTIVAFSGVLWSISPWLFLAAVGYAALGSLATIALGRPLVRLDYDQSDREASFRAELVRVAEHAESVALLQLEGRLEARLRLRLDALVANARRIFAVNRNLGFFTTGYNYGVQLIPPLIVGPLFMRGRVEFGVVMQSAMAFAQLLGAFSLIVTQFQSISSYAAVLVRLGTFEAAVGREIASVPTPSAGDEGPARLIYDHLTLHSENTGEPLLAELTLTVPAGMRLLVTGTDEARRALFRATALGRDGQEPRVVCPGAQRVLFLPERPYVPLGTLRELIVGAGREHHVDEPQIEAVLRELGLDAALRRLGGIDVEGDFNHELSLSEQQLLALAHVVLAKPAFAVLQSPGNTLAPEQLVRALALLSKASITYIALGGADAPASAYDAVLEIHANGTWSFRRSA
jgi:vitamin B12/bleomycin/antimicrobial peptide transport system ATP-binding/permease protein